MNYIKKKLKKKEYIRENLDIIEISKKKSNKNL